MGVKFGLHTKRSTKSEGIRDEYGADNGIWIYDEESTSMMKKAERSKFMIYTARHIL